MSDTIVKSIISQVKTQEIKSSFKWASENNYDHLIVVGILKSLESKESVILVQNDFVEIKLTSQGELLVKNGSPEAILWNKLGNEKIPQQDCAKFIGFDAETTKTAIGNGMKLGFFSIEKNTSSIIRKASKISDSVQIECQKIISGENLDKKSLDALKRRNYIVVKTIKEYSISRGPKIDEFGVVYDTDLTEDMITTGSWKNCNFKKYNFNSLGVKLQGGALHPLLKIRQEFREIFLELGFEEMPTNMFVESSFWNFDALFQPQFHPTRDMHDTFFIKDPQQTLQIPEDYLQKVKEVHEVGGYESIGYRYKWERSEAYKNILRTHTTSISTRMLYQLAQSYQKTGVFTPKKYFSIDRVFRNESTDQTHLAEFHQCEGVIADYGLTLRDLIGMLSSYFEKQGLRDIQLKPAYNPYTEPSMEIFAFHKGLNKIVEIGNSGIFRPEMLRAMGLPEEVRVLAWGVSLERPAMIKYEISDIRSLIGPEVLYEFIRENPICRIEKD